MIITKFLHKLVYIDNLRFFVISSLFDFIIRFLNKLRRGLFDFDVVEGSLVLDLRRHFYVDAQVFFCYLRLLNFFSLKTGSIWIFL